MRASLLILWVVASVAACGDGATLDGHDVSDATDIFDTAEADAIAEADSAEADTTPDDTREVADDTGVTDTATPEDTVEADGADAIEDVAEDVIEEVADADATDPVDTLAAADAESDTASAWTPPEPVGCLTEVSAGHHVVSCEGGLLYDVEIPAACTTAPCGLIVDIHGWTMTAASEDANTDMRARGRDRGFVVIQPTASLLVGVPTWGLDADAPRVHAFVLDAITALRIDTDRVHVMGFSQGGGMTWRLLCTHPEVYASAAPIGPITGCSFAGDQAPAGEVDILDVHGRNDAVVSYSTTGRPQVDAAVAYWPFGAGVVVEEDADHTVTRWTTPSGTVLEHWAHDYEATSVLLRGHCFPGSPQLIAFPVAFGCADTGTFDYAALAVAFFEAHPRD
ncbi:MAG: hypothetical protein EP329_24090 [Deltaproteobacteria bacterium]|nr:MAG: hypothetical protein EP329_24090 [Deltaproteobacteria bacterium]